MMLAACHTTLHSLLWMYLFLLVHQCVVNGFISNRLDPISAKRLSSSSWCDHSLTPLVVVHAARRADDITVHTNTTKAETRNPKLRGMRHRHFGQKLRTWMQSYEALLEFKRLKQHCRVPQLYSQDRALGRWAQEIRSNGREFLSSEQLNLLDAAGFDWETREERFNRLWQEKYQKLVEYKEVYGDCCVPQKYEDDKALGVWVYNQRSNRKQGLLRVDREEQLDAIGFTWSVVDRANQRNTTYADRRWNDTFARLLEFREEFGHCLVPRYFEEDPSLAVWVHTQRTMFKRGLMWPDRKDRLVEVEFVFDPSNADRNLEAMHWDLMFQHLVDYNALHGHTNVKQRHEEFGLGLWVTTQRKNRSMMDEQRKQQLDAIGFQWTNAHSNSSAWPERFEELREHIKLHGTCRVKVKENPGLARWVISQRYRVKFGKLSELKVKQFESIGFD